MLPIESPRAVVLLSGGLDSATVLAIAKAEGFEPFAMTFDYGQRHAIEIRAARRVAEHLGVAWHLVMPLNLRAFGQSALTDDTEVPKGRSVGEMSSGVPSTYVPARNTVFLSLALAWAEVLGAQDIFIGVNALDNPGYPDCRPEYIAAFERMANLATRAATEEGARLSIHAPLMMLTKAQIIGRGLELGVDYSLTHTCYAPTDDGVACGECDACQLRLAAFAEVGVGDPVRYRGT